MRIRYVRSSENKWERSWRTVGMKREKKQFVHSFGSQIKSDFGERNVKQTPPFPFYSQINRDVISNKFPWISVTRFYSVFEWEEKGKKGWNSTAKNKNDSSLFFFNFFSNVVRRIERDLQWIIKKSFTEIASGIIELTFDIVFHTCVRSIVISPVNTNIFSGGLLTPHHGAWTNCVSDNRE